MEIHSGVTCDACRGPVFGVRHKCTVCPDYDLCNDCQEKGFHAEHQLREILRPMDSFLHFGVICDGCRGEVRGKRYKCNDCFNYDLCSGCKEKEIHNQHSMREIHLNQSNSLNLGLGHLVNQVRVRNRSALQPRGCLHLGVICDGCKGEVRGIRYKCNDCFNYDLCSQCKAKGIHSQHSMREIHKPTQTQAPPSDFMHFAVTCDGCNGEVRGIRYKCNDCSNYDLCCQCQAKGIHSQHSKREIHPPTNPGVGLVNQVGVGEASASRPKRSETELSSLSCKLGAIQLDSTDTTSLTGSSSIDGKASTTGDPFTRKWGPAQTGVTFKRVILDSSDQEYKAVISKMMAEGGQQWTDKVKQVCRIENHKMYKIYKACKEEMERENPPGFQNERILWHGTSANVLSNIYRDGFNRSYCGKNATAFGDGVYFATSFSYSTSSTYSPPDSDGQKFVFQCRVLTGHFITGEKGMKEPPMRTEELRFDSVADAITSPKMFVIFKDMQVYPEYVITLKL